jgi:hypothetical protein
MRPKPFRYFPVKKITAATIVELTGIEDLARFADLNQLKDVLVMLDEANQPTHFALLYNNGIMQHDALGYKNIEDFYLAKESGFPDSATYYTAIKQGYTTYKQFHLVQTAGIGSKEEFDLVEKGGFVEGFSQMNARNIEAGEPIPGNASNPLELYKHALSKDFEDYASFSDALQKGFDDYDTYLIATQKGFPAFAEYEAGYARGFDTYEKVLEADALHVRNFEDMLRYKEVTTESCVGCTCDQQVLLRMLSRQPEGKKQSINKLTEGLKETIETFRYEDTQQLPEWFTIALDTRDAVIGFLRTNDQVKQFGAYDDDGEFFDVIHRKNRAVVIDGSNIAHNSVKGDNGGRPAFYENITRVVKHLQSKGFTDIKVFSDNSLKKKVKDPENLAALQALTHYTEMPVNTSADVFLLEMVKRNRCLVVTNDQFKDWCRKDPWTASNIKDYKLNFSIIGEEVIITTSTEEAC